jgi:hypothetical protein
VTVLQILERLRENETLQKNRGKQYLMEKKDFERFRDFVRRAVPILKNYKTLSINYKTLSRRH